MRFKQLSEEKGLTMLTVGSIEEWREKTAGTGGWWRRMEDVETWRQEKYKKGLDEGYCRGMLGSGWFKTSFGGRHTRLVSGLDRGLRNRTESRVTPYLLVWKLGGSYLMKWDWGNAIQLGEEIQETYFGFGEFDILIGCSGRDVGEGTDFWKTLEVFQRC